MPTSLLLQYSQWNKLKVSIWDLQHLPPRLLVITQWKTYTQQVKQERSSLAVGNFILTVVQAKYFGAILDFIFTSNQLENTIATRIKIPYFMASKRNNLSHFNICDVRMHPVINGALYSFSLRPWSCRSYLACTPANTKMTTIELAKWVSAAWEKILR